MMSGYIIEITYYLKLSNYVVLMLLYFHFAKPHCQHGLNACAFLLNLKLPLWFHFYNIIKFLHKNTILEIFCFLSITVSKSLLHFLV